jgi:ribosome-binding factor A
MATKRRTNKVGERIQEIVASRLLSLSDPRLYLVTITEVVITSDLRYAKIYWTVSESDKRKEDAEIAFEASAGMFKNAVAKELSTRFVPEIKFIYDNSLDKQMHMEGLLAKALGSIEK